jgi:post-segregation antitoxin (ccd killing protein)
VRIKADERKGVYPIHMARIKVYLPDGLAEEVSKADLNVSKLAQEALRSALMASKANRWLDDVAALGPTGVDHDTVLEAVIAAKHDLEGYA